MALIPYQAVHQAFEHGTDAKPAPAPLAFTGALASHTVDECGPCGSNKKFKKCHGK